MTCVRKRSQVPFVVTRSQPRRGLTRLEFAAIIGGVLALNVAAAIIYRVKFRDAPKPVVTTRPADPTPEVDLASERYKELRGAGLTALSAADYSLAVERFTEALKFGKADSDIIELLKMAKQFKESGGQKEPEPELPLEPEPPTPTPAAPTKAAVRPTPRPVRRPEPPRKPEPARGSILVTSSPAGLIVEIDGVRRDLTPAKIQTTVGQHAVSLLKGSTRLTQRLVDVDADQVALVDADVADLVNSLTTAATGGTRPEPPKPEPKPAPVTAVPTPAPEPVKEPEPVKPPPPAAVRMVTPTETGEVFVTAASLGGIVFINGSSFGPSPLLARGIPVGTTVVELKSPEGEVRRSKEITVKVGERAEVRFR